MSKQVWASEFSDSTGCYDNNLNDGGYYYAELSTNPNAKAKDLDYAALGKLKKNHKLKITYNGKTEYATKGDVGRGHLDPGNKLRQIDLHKTLADKLGFSGLDYVTIEDA
jgi:hypothetical protein